MGSNDIIDVILYEKGSVQYRLSISEFKDSKYITIREWYLSFDEEWCPTKNGVSFPYTLHSTRRMYSALRELLSKAEVLTEVEQDEENT
jgi:hypothetical protein